MTEDKLEGTGLPAHGLVNLDVSWVLALPLYLYVEPWVETWSNSLLKVSFARKARVLLGLQDKTPGFPASGPLHQVPGVWPLASAKQPFKPSISPVGFTPWPK